MWPGERLLGARQRRSDRQGACLQGWLSAAVGGCSGRGFGDGQGFLPNALNVFRLSRLLLLHRPFDYVCVVSVLISCRASYRGVFWPQRWLKLSRLGFVSV